MKNILVVDDHPLVLQVMGALARSLFAEADVRLADSLAGAEEATRGGETLDMVVLDLSLPGYSGISALTRFREIAPDVPVVVFSAHEDPHIMHASLDAGARGYIPKTRGNGVISAALLLVAAGDIYVPPEIRRTHERAMTQSVRFTDRQRQVLRGIAQGLSNKQIARSLSIAEETVKHHIKPVFAALGITSRAQAASAVTRHGIKLD